MPQREQAYDEASAGPNDIDQLARHLDGFDPARYFDRQADDAWRNAARRWPVIAAVLRVDEKSRNNT
ncbi:hypothetical protein [Paraburkholderia susongensis]|uniref:Cellulose biosynthesis protein BcsR n=1 Tax=Paraburkholderia susongensis TaxID=1515439 RepID=A0A1X7LRD1_9BURK|nr:hypothetical protein [Paraburkholderia susongensis]SMG56365.1 hypothetical protein SAMN06265784_108156 [Paraburkholderia susongensis]